MVTDVKMQTNIRRHSVSYVVKVGRRMVWSRTVVVSNKCPAGGPAFREAAREQELQAHKWMDQQFRAKPKLPSEERFL